MKGKQRIALSILLAMCAAAAPSHGTDPFPPPPPKPMPAQSQQAPPVEQMVDGLRQRLEREPGDMQGWVLLGRSYRYLGKEAEASAAFARARELGYNGAETAAPPRTQPAHASSINPMLMREIGDTIEKAKSEPAAVPRDTPPSGSAAK